MEHKPTQVRTDQAEPTWETAYMSAASLPATIGVLRQRIMEFLSLSSFSRDELADLEIAVGEACANAMKHGSPNGEVDEIRIKCAKSKRTLVVEISDNGDGFDPLAVQSPDLENAAECGMGIHLMQRLVDSVEFEFNEGTTVRLVKHSSQS